MLKSKRTIIIILLWTVLAVLVESVVFSVVENAVTYKKHDVGIVKYAEVGTRSKEITVYNIPEDASGIKLSYDASYVSYLKDGKIILMDTKSGKIIKTINSNFDEINYCKWLPDRNLIVYSANKQISKNETEINIFTYDLDSDIYNEYDSIKNLPKNSITDEILFSVTTHVTYVRINTEEKSKRVYRYGIMGEQKYLFDVSNNSEIALSQNEDMFFFKGTDNKIYVKNGENKAKIFSNDRNSYLLGIASDTKAYIAVTNKKNNVIKILIENSIKNKILKTVKPKILTNPESIIITNNGKIYSYNDTINSLINIENNSVTKYSGKIVDVIDGYVASFDGKVLETQELSK